ncbi:MAG: glycosyltransferase [Prevotella sp.]|nr:glycosyltransferase [Prevotella sp.]
MDTNARPQVSIIMPLYNRAEVVQATIDSVLQQTYCNFELICVDDGSTDNVLSILADYAAKDSRVKIVTKPHTNAGDARNLGYRVSVGEYIFFLDADDLYHKYFIEKMLSAMQQKKADLVICDCQCFNHGDSFPLSVLQTENGGGVCTYLRTVLLEKIFAWGCAVWRRLFRRQIIDQYQIEFQSLNCAEDHLFVFNYTLHCTNAVRLFETLAWHRINDTASVSNLRNQTLDLYCYCSAMDAVQSCITAEDFPRLQNQFLNFYFGETCYAIVRSHYRQGKRIFQFARRHLQPLQTIKIKKQGNKYRVKAQKLYRFCLRTNQYWLFFYAKNLMLKLTLKRRHNTGDGENGNVAGTVRA